MRQAFSKPGNGRRGGTVPEIELYIETLSSLQSDNALYDVTESSLSLKSAWPRSHGES